MAFLFKKCFDKDKSYLLPQLLALFINECLLLLLLLNKIIKNIDKVEKCI